MRFTSIDFQALSRKSLALMLTGFVTLFVSFYIFLSLADDVWEIVKGRPIGSAFLFKY